MMKWLLISDANIIIDLEKGQITKKIFQIPYRVAVVDTLYEEELINDHKHLIDLGLLSLELSGRSINYLQKIKAQYNAPSTNDLASLALAKQEGGVLLTGDKALKKTAKNENVRVHGTIWVVKKMKKYHLINLKEAKLAFKRMKECGRRLPWGDIERFLQNWHD